MSLFYLSSAAASAGQATLEWEPSPSAVVAGYEVHYGLASGDYTDSVVAGNQTSRRITGLKARRTYYFAVKAYRCSSPICRPLTATTRPGCAGRRRIGTVPSQGRRGAVGRLGEGPRQRGCRVYRDSVSPRSGSCTRRPA
ncbi:MAG: fibronectin type III domain-containing protein [Gammaproteobacteria bacterium]|nr:fibronectin type III domain-containing protein [Gammaproteobacteria bacterium]NIR90081.1 fibronectin type III domain-containing protein [Gammaproteobacteria bacterium]NIU03285.1 fibronectin type III domain-containing protein [Gammaproteobacteria bacterium]NIV50779.1 hypothetical protein [Gammaproteobacteria bacterium]NIV75365.1 hypothetical protein [Gammaproteobacteria bacterium]